MTFSALVPKSRVAPWILAALLVSAGVVGPVLPAAAVVDTPGAIETIEPIRRFDTRRTSPLGAGKTLTLTLAVDAGSATVVPPVASGAFVNLAIVGATKPGFATVFPAGSSRPLASSINFSASQSAYANHLLVKIGTAGKVLIYNGSAAPVHVVLDVTGYVVSGSSSAPGTTVPLTPTRVLDTATANGAPLAPVEPGGQLDVQIGGRSGVPASGVAGVWLELTVASPQAGGYVVAWPAGQQRPPVSTVNFGPRQTVANQVFIQLGASGRVSFANASSGWVRLVGDVVGYTRSGAVATEGAMIPIPPHRVLDTHSGDGAPANPVAARQSITVQIAGRAGVPLMGVRAVMLNVTAAAATTSGYLAISSRPGPRAPVSTLNFGPGRAIANMVLAPLAPDGTITFYNGSAGEVRIIADVSARVLGPQAPAGTLAISNGATAGSIEGVVSISDDGRFVAYDGIYLWDAETQATVLMPGSPWDPSRGGPLPGGGPPGILSGNGQHVLYHSPPTDGGQDGPIRVWDRSGGSSVVVTDASTDRGSISDDGAYVAYAEPGQPGEPTTVWRWSRATGEREAVATVPAGQPVSSRISGDGRTILYQVTEHPRLSIALYRWQVATGRSEEIAHGKISDVSDDGNAVLMITTDDDGRPEALVLWSDGATTVLTQSPAGSSREALSGNGRVAVWSGAGEGAGVYRKEVGERAVKLMAYPPDFSTYAMSLAVTDDGARIAYVESASSRDGYRYGKVVLLR